MKMRDFISFLVNGQRHEVRGESVFTTLADYLRNDGATGTKIVCAEGDCGACTVLVRRAGGFVPVNSCIQSLLQLDGTSVVTVEGIGRDSSTGAAVQQSMIESHGAQCGYCTPGFVVAMTALFEERDRVGEAEVRSGLTGNLCRCTGYEPILKAGTSIDAHDLVRMNDAYPAGEDDGTSILIETGSRRFFAPVTVDEAIAFKASNPGCTIVQGGTDVGVWINKRGFRAPALMTLTKIRALDELRIDDGAIVAGANATLSAFDALVAERMPELHEILSIFGSPQIRNAGTLIGNIANGSPIADTLPYLFVSGATLELAGKSGTRTVPVAAFYRGYKQFDLGADEIITSVRVPVVRSDAPAGEVMKLYKVSRRHDLDISAFTAAIRLRLTDSRIDAAAIAYGGVAPVVLRLQKTEEFLAGKPFALATFREAGQIACSEIAPISDVRGSREYRMQLAENILTKFFFDAKRDGGAGAQPAPLPGGPQHATLEGAAR